MKINFINHTKTRLPKKFVQACVDLAVKEMRAKPVRNESRLKRGELTLVFLGSAEARKTNLQYRGKDYATDVLSFESGDADSADYLGDLVLCVPVCQRQAKEHELSFNEELAYLIIHGILHLLGYDHEQSKTQEKIMLSIQDKIFEKVVSRLTRPSRS